MHDDDRPVGTLLSRREAMRLFAATGMALSTGPFLHAQRAGSACVVRPELEEGPYFVDRRTVRADVRTDSTTGRVSAGVPLQLSFAVAALAQGRCMPLRDANVHVWQCDAVGEYSGVSGPGQRTSERARDFLRGVQPTDASGLARFTTIYPGWYPGRAVHTHFKIRTTGPDAQPYEFTSQLFYPDDLTDRIHADAPYQAHGRRDRTNARDGIYRNGGEQLLLEPARQANGSYHALVAIALDLSDAATARPDGGSRRNRR